MLLNMSSCTDGDNCDLCTLLYSRYMEVVAVIRIMEQKLNELRSRQLNKGLLKDITSASTISFSTFALPWILSKALPFDSIIISILVASGIFMLVSKSSQKSSNAGYDDLEILEDAIRWFEKLREAYGIMLKACNKDLGH